MQIREGSVVVTNGSSAVYGVWRFTLTGVTGTFVAGEAVTFAPSGATGVVVAWDSVQRVLSAYITSVTPPAETNTVSQSPTVGTGTVPAQGIAFNPSWNTAGIPAGAVFTKAKSGIPYYIDHVDTPGKLTITAPYAGITEVGIEFSITTSRTPGAGIPYVEDGDRDYGAVLKAGMLRIDGLVSDVIGIGLDGTLSGNARKSVRVRADENALELFEAVDRNATNVSMGGNLVVGGTLVMAGTITAYGGIDSEAVRLVGAPSQAAFQNGWLNHGDSVSIRYPAGYWKQADRVVHVRGCVTKTGLPNGEAIFTLPTGYRPSRRILVPIVAADFSIALLQIEADGVVSKVSGTTSADYIVLDGCPPFRAEQ